MKHFTKLTQGFIGLALLTASIGCGGTTGAGAQTSLAGSYVESPLSSFNTRITITANGGVTGQSLNGSIGGTDLLTGTLSSNGTFIGQVTNDTDNRFTYGVIGTIKAGTVANQIRVTYRAGPSMARRSAPIRYLCETNFTTWAVALFRAIHGVHP